MKGYLLLVLRVVTVTFGGGSAIVGTLRRELVDRRKWLSQQDFGMYYAVSRITPGTNIFAFCAATGWHLASWRGGLLGLLAASVPCTAILICALIAYDHARDNPMLIDALRGAMAAAIGVILVSAWEILQPYLQGRSRMRNLALFLASGFLMMVGGFSPIPILALAASIGFLFPTRSAE